MKEYTKIMGLATIYWVWMVVLVVIATIVGLAIYGTQLNLQRRIQQHSAGYNQARVTALTQFMGDFSRLDTKIAENKDNAELVKTYHAQQAMIIQQMWQQYDLVPSDAKDSVPMDIRSFLGAHPRNWQP